MSRPMLRTIFLLRYDIPVFLSALSINLHTSQIFAGKCHTKKSEPISAAIIICGCGVLDGTEISEAVSAAIHLRQKNMKPIFYAPDVPICGVVDHFTKEIDTTSPPRNALTEAARLARSCIQPICECEACTHGALIIPGGYGAAQTMSNFAEKGANCTVLPDVEKLIEDFYCQRKPIGSMCIASAIIAKVLKGVKVTLGKESPKECWPHADCIKKVKDMGAKIEMKDVKGVTQCKKYNVFSTPAWLYDPATYAEIHQGIGKLITMLNKCVKK